MTVYVAQWTDFESARPWQSRCNDAELDMGMAITPEASDIAAREFDIVLRDGSTLHVRPVRPDDEPKLRVFFRSLSDESRWFRFFGGGGEHFLTEAARRSAFVDDGTFSLIATAESAGDIIGQALYVPTGDDHAEIALAVADAYQGRGLGTIFLGHLAAAARTPKLTAAASRRAMRRARRPRRPTARSPNGRESAQPYGRQLCIGDAASHMSRDPALAEVSKSDLRPMRLTCGAHTATLG
jgi:GNAT superfamily N-acetyltransferase